MRYSVVLPESRTNQSVLKEEIGRATEKLCAEAPGRVSYFDELK